MSKASGYLCGQNWVKRYKLGATAAATLLPGIPFLMVATTGGVGPVTATAGADCVGLSLGSPSGAGYTTTQATVLASGEGMIDIEINPHLVIESVQSGATTSGTAMQLATNTVASAGGTVVTGTGLGAGGDIDGGMIWRYQYGVAGELRTITTHTSTTDLRVTVPFSTAIAVGDTFLYSTYNETGNGAAGGDGNSNITLTSDLLQADSSAASGAGIDCCVVNFIAAGQYDTLLQWVLGDHIFNDSGSLA
jgi:hypothetical protein